MEAKDKDLETLLARMEQKEVVRMYAREKLLMAGADLDFTSLPLQLNFRDLMARKDVDYQRTDEQLATTTSRLATTSSQLRKKELELQEIQVRHFLLPYHP